MKIEIEQFDPCEDALEFRKQFSTFEEAWQACPRGDWMLWITSQLNVDIRKLFLAKGLCAQTVVHLMKDERSVNAVNAAIRYGKGEISDAELRKFYHSAEPAAYSSCPTAHQRAAHSNAAYAALYATDYACPDAAVAEHAADSFSFSLRADNQKQTADICREILTEEVMKKINKNLTN